MDEETRWQRLIAGLRGGDGKVLQEFWEQYGDLLHKIADRHLAPGVRRRVGPEDVVQSACRSFFRRARLGEFHLSDSEALWRLLCAITLTKVREQRAFIYGKRGLAQETAPDPTAMDQSSVGPAAPGPSPAEAAAFADELEKLLAGLDEEERQIVDLKLQDYTHEEVAEHLGCSERTVRRIVKRVQGRLARTFDAD